MPSPTALKTLTDRLHISHSQIFTYLNCSLKYQFRYVLRFPPERISLSLPFGSAIHKAIELYYRNLIEDREAPLKLLQETFSDHLSHELNEKGEMVIYKKDTPDRDSAIQLGCAMLDAFHKNADFKGCRVIAVELPLAATLYTTEGTPTDLVVVDHKTAARAKTRSDVDSDLQMTAYTYLLAANCYVFPTALVQCRFDVLRKLKTLKLEHYHTSRGADDRRRLARIATGVLAGIEAGVFIPSRSWMCADCEYAKACANWPNE